MSESRGIWPSILVMTVAVLVTACAAPPATATPIPSPTSQAQRTAIPSTATSIPTATIPTPTATVAPTATKLSAMATTPPVTATPATLVSSSGPTAKIDLDKIFPPGKGRDLVLYNCTGCHSFVRLVIGQRTLEAWQAVRRRMAPKASGLGDQEIDDLFTYLEANFNDAKPVPSIPDWLLGSY